MTRKPKPDWERADGVDGLEAPLIVPREQSGLPLDKFLAIQFPQIDRAYLRSLIRAGRVTVDGAPMTSSRALWGNAVVMLAAEENPAVWQEKDEKGAAVLYEDAELAIVDKPSGLALHPHTLTRHVPDLEPARGDAFHFVGKMESEMSGVFPIAKSLPCARALESQYSGGSVVLEVGGIVEGVPDEDSWEIDLPLGPDERKSGRRVVNREHGDPAVTRVEVRERYDGFAEVAAFPMTHRTHQVRAHLAASGYPPAVDAIYGGRAEVELSDLKRHYVKKVGRHEKPILTRVSLHARAIGLVSPAKGAVRVESPWPPELARLRSALERHRPS
jgi:23S rRNA pseudouridine1911/1915/1917 synthase